MLSSFWHARSGRYDCQAKKKHLLPESVSTHDAPHGNWVSPPSLHNSNETWPQHSQLAVDVNMDVEVAYELTDAAGQIKSAGPMALQQQGHPCCEEHVDSLHTHLVSEAATQQQLLVNSLLLEQRTHYKSVRWLGCLTFVLVLALGGIMMTLDHGIHLNSNTEASLPVSHFFVLAIVCCPPLWLVWEGHAQKRQLDQEITSSRTNTLANQPSLLGTSHNSKQYTAPPPLDPLPSNFPVVL